jgi:hypothetical protein
MHVSFSGASGVPFHDTLAVLRIKLDDELVDVALVEDGALEQPCGR